MNAKNAKFGIWYAKKNNLIYFALLMVILKSNCIVIILFGLSNFISIWTVIYDCRQKYSPKMFSKTVLESARHIHCVYSTEHKTHFYKYHCFLFRFVFVFFSRLSASRSRTFFALFLLSMTSLALPLANATNSPAG